jgi:hypothetical protein
MIGVGNMNPRDVLEQLDYCFSGLMTETNGVVIYQAFRSLIY